MVFTLYSLLLTLAFILMSPLFLLRREKYAQGFGERLGKLPEFDSGGRPVIWLHCVSVGEVNAARSFISLFAEEFPGHSLVVSTTTRTGQELAKNIFKDKADAVFYFPFDWKFTVRRALRRFKPAAVLLMETEIWPNFIREAKLSGAKVMILNGRLSQMSFDRYWTFRFFISKVLSFVDAALMQAPRDAQRIVALGMHESRTIVSGNLKFDQDPLESQALTDELRSRFGIDAERPLIIAASTHSPEESVLLEALRFTLGMIPARLMIAPRHPERFDSVANAIEESGLTFVRRSADPSDEDRDATVILLDSIGELRSAYPLAEIVFCGGSLIPHGGQSMLEPAAEGKPVVTGHHTHNFANAVEVFKFHDALVQLPPRKMMFVIRDVLITFVQLLSDESRRKQIGRNALDVMMRNRGAARRSVELLKKNLQ